MTPGTLLLALTGLTGFLFSATIFRRCYAGNRLHRLIFAVGLFLWSTAVFLWFLREVTNISEPTYRIWYLSGAMLVPLYFGIGLLIALTRVQLARASLAIILVIGSVVALLISLIPDLQYPLSALPPGERLSAIHVSGGTFFPEYVTIITLVMNLCGLFAIGGSVVVNVFALGTRVVHRDNGTDQSGGPSVGRLRILGAVSSLFILLGILVSSGGGSLETINLPQPHLLGLPLGICVVFLGVLIAPNSFEKSRVVRRFNDKSGPFSSPTRTTQGRWRSKRG